MNIRSTAANSSRVRKRPAISPIKKHRDSLKKLLPGQARLKQKLAPSPTIKSPDEPLQIQNYDVQLDFQLPNGDDILAAIDTVLENQWAEQSLLHDRFHSNEVVHSCSQEDLLFLLRGISMEQKAEIVKYRHSYLSGNLVTLNQLYTVFEHQGHTFVDKSLELKMREGTIRKFVITNALPIISRSPLKFQTGKVSYGFEDAVVVAKNSDYEAAIDRSIATLEKEASGPKDPKYAQFTSLRKFQQYVAQHRNELFVGPNELLSAKDLSILVPLGYVTLTSNHHNEIESHQYSISYPNCGTFLKLINAGRSWLVKTLSKNTFKESLELSLHDKWEGVTQTTSKLTNFRKPFYGYDFYWILADALGAGVVEVFNTPVGRGWKLTGKL